MKPKKIQRKNGQLIGQFPRPVGQPTGDIAKFLPEEEGEKVSCFTGELIEMVQDYIGRNRFGYRAFFYTMDITPDDQDLVKQFCQVVKSVVASGGLDPLFYIALITGCIVGDGEG